MSQFYNWNPYALIIILANGLDLLTVSPYIGPSPQDAQGLSQATMFVLVWRQLQPRLLLCHTRPRELEQQPTVSHFTSAVSGSKLTLADTLD